MANLAKVFTGLSWPDSRWFGDWEKNYWSYVGRMKFYAQDTRNPSRIVDAHEGGTKTFLGQTIPARPVAQGEQDIQDALNIVFNHPNTAPFVCRRLIQRLVTSNPSPAYIQRVASVFNNNGSGVRGDLKAVVKAILLDFEARDTSNPDLYSKNSRGHLREPFIRYMNIMKGLNLNNNNGPIRNVMFQVYDKLEQIPMWSPSVFNFFQPDYAPSGPVKDAAKYAPEFQLLNSQNLTGYMNALQRWIVSNNPTDWWGFFPTEKYKPSQDPGFDFSADFPLTRNDRLPELIDKYNMLFANGAISPQNQVFIRNAVAGLPYAESNGVINTDLADRRMRVLIYLSKFFGNACFVANPPSCSITIRTSPATILTCVVKYRGPLSE
ncbi:MAG: DUF1800 family protein [Arcicella sp.]|nr:DUF1800 family protein [Arcicella sp.]